MGTLWYRKQQVVGYSHRCFELHGGIGAGTPDFLQLAQAHVCAQWKQLMDYQTNSAGRHKSALIALYLARMNRVDRQVVPDKKAVRPLENGNLQKVGHVVMPVHK